MMNQGVINRANSFFPVWVRQRELRQRLPLGQSDIFYKSLYSSISPCHSWDGGESSKSDHGGLSSLEFSPEGTHLVAGSVKNSFLIFDPLTRRLIRTVPNAHAGCVTHVKFLDSRTFATGGVDGCVSLWDTRNLKSRCRTLVVHSRRIGNIEFLRSNDLLITSGLAGIIYIWDLKNWSKRKVFNTFKPHVLLRLRLSPDETKMIISTASGYLLIVHELDLNRIAQGLNEFVVKMFDSAPLPQVYTASDWNSGRFLTPRRHNRMEIVADFPNTGGFNVFSALEMHPQGMSAFSRSRNEASGQEWSCVHDLQERDPSEGGAEPLGGSEGERPLQDGAERSKPHRLQRINGERKSESGDGKGTGEHGRNDVGFCTPRSNDSSTDLPGAGFSLERRSPKMRRRRRRYDSPADSARAWSTILTPSSPPHHFQQVGIGSSVAATRVLDCLLPRFNPSFTTFNRRVHVRYPRLTHFIEEPYFSEWYMESLGVSADGRLVCSPLERGIRLLSFSPECSEHSVSWCGTEPRSLYELSTHTSHSDMVTCTKFSPRHCLLVSGSLDGKVVWYQPVV